MNRNDIIDAWTRIRTRDQVIPDEVLDYMKDAAIQKLQGGDKKWVMGGQETTSSPTMKPFNLQQALAGKKVITRDGREVLKLTHFDTKQDFTLFGVVSSQIVSWSSEGKCGLGYMTSLDLFMAPETKEVWVNAYRSHGNKNGIFISQPFQTKEEAEKNINDKDRYLGAYQITINL